MRLLLPKKRIELWQGNFPNSELHYWKLDKAIVDRDHMMLKEAIQNPNGMKNLIDCLLK